MEARICDFEDCTEYAWISIRVLDDEKWQGLDWDACSWKHAKLYLVKADERSDEIEQEEAAAR